MSVAAQFPPLSAAVTRILSLSGFPAQLKTRDIQGAFSEWENMGGGFKIKWLDDTNLLMVFADATVAKRAYLQALAQPHPIFSTPTTGNLTTIRPYDGPDAQAVIQAVGARGQGAHRARASMSAGATPSASVAAAQAVIRGAIRQSPPSGREPSPTLPALPQQPPLGALIQAGLDEGVNGNGNGGVQGAPPKIGDPGRRMVGAALGIRHPGLAHRSPGSGNDTPKTSSVSAGSNSD